MGKLFTAVVKLRTKKRKEKRLFSMGTESKVAELLLKSGAVILRPQKPFRFASGIFSPIYCDNRLLLSKPSERKLLRDFYVRKIGKESVEADVIAVIATASIQ